MPYVTSPDGCRIHYSVQGAGSTPVVLVQGLGLSSRFWFDVPDRLLAENSDLRIVLPDNRGTGFSDRSPKLFRVRTMADDVARVLDACDIDAAHVVGISMGGMIAQQLALRHKSRVKGLVLMATTPGLPYGRLPPMKSLATLLTMPSKLRKEESAIHIAKLLLPEAEWPRAREIFDGWIDLIQTSPVEPRAFFDQFAAVCAHWTGKEIADISCPTHVITGDSDALIPPKNSEWLSQRIPGAELHVLAGVGHAIPAQDRDVVARTVSRLIARVGGGTAEAPRKVA